MLFAGFSFGFVSNVIVCYLQVSLSVLSVIIHDGGFPQLDILEYFLSCVEALIKLLLSGCRGLESKQVFKNLYLVTSYFTCHILY